MEWREFLNKFVLHFSVTKCVCVCQVERRDSQSNQDNFGKMQKMATLCPPRKNV